MARGSFNTSISLSSRFTKILLGSFKILIKTPDGIYGVTEKVIAPIAEEITERTREICFIAKTDAIETQVIAFRINLKNTTVVVEVASLVRYINLSITGDAEEVAVLIKLKALEMETEIEETTDSVRKNTFTEKITGAEVDKADNTFEEIFAIVATELETTTLVKNMVLTSTGVAKETTALDRLSDLDKLTTLDEVADNARKSTFIEEITAVEVDNPDRALEIDFTITDVAEEIAALVSDITLEIAGTTEEVAVLDRLINLDKFAAVDEVADSVRK